MTKESKPTENEKPIAEAAKAQPQPTEATSEKPKFPYIHPETGMTVAREIDGVPCTATGIDCRAEAEWRKPKPAKKPEDKPSTKK